MTEAHSLEHHLVHTNGVRLHTVQAGNRDAPLVLLLHGFPEFWYAWKHQITALAAAGFRVWAPDQRGYGESSKPRGVAAYAIDELVADAVGLIDASGSDAAHVVGHDWGGAVAWRLAATHPERVRRLAVLNCPHPHVMAKYVRSHPAQAARSAYILFFQLPVLPELVLGARGAALLERTLVRTSRRSAFSDEDLMRYHEAWARPGAMRAMINWYRGIRRGVGRRGDRRIRVPTLVLWGARDRFLGQEMAEQSIARCEDGRLTVLRDATHWLHHEEPERVSLILADFLRGPQGSQG
jgi:epoxide hydrolase 4